MKTKIGVLEQKILNKLIENNYDAMVIGGAVRDYLLDEEIYDIDITTNAPYEVLEVIMKDIASIELVGKNFGVLIVGGVEVATYRIDNYNDSDLVVEKANTVYDDSIRRDFTINSIYYDFKNDKFIDYHNGIADIENNVIRTVGNPYDRFEEDYSRILRAVYLASKLGFTIDSATGKAMQDLGHKLNKVPNALIGKIIKKTIQAGTFYKFLKLLEIYDLLQYIFPELVHTVGLPQNPAYHKFDVWNHIIAVVKAAETKYRGNVAFVIGALLHDVAKGLEGIRAINKAGQPSDIGHEEAGVPIAKVICHRLELGKSITKEVIMYVKWHGVRFPAKAKSIRKFLFKFKAEFKNIEELKHNFNMLLDFMLCDAEGFADDFGVKMKEETENIREKSKEVFDKQIFYSNQFDFNASIISEHPKVEKTKIREWIDFFLLNNIKEEDRVLKILDKQ